MKHQTSQIEDRESLVSLETARRILAKAKELGGIHVANVNSTYYGGIVAKFVRNHLHSKPSLSQHNHWFAGATQTHTHP